MANKITIIAKDNGKVQVVLDAEMTLQDATSIVVLVNPPQPESGSDHEANLLRLELERWCKSYGCDPTGINLIKAYRTIYQAGLVEAKMKVQTLYPDKFR